MGRISCQILYKNDVLNLFHFLYVSEHTYPTNKNNDISAGQKMEFNSAQKWLHPGFPLILPINSCILPTGGKTITCPWDRPRIWGISNSLFGEKIFNTISLMYGSGMMTIGMFNGNVYLVNGFCLLYSYMNTNNAGRLICNH